MKRWDELGIYRWDPTLGRDETFAVDTPPLTVSGSLHVGHVFSYTHQDVLVRFQRMRGKNIAYPMAPSVFEPSPKWWSSSKVRASQTFRPRSLMPV